jgi:hypothetical protein
VDECKPLDPGTVTLSWLKADMVPSSGIYSDVILGSAAAAAAAVRHVISIRLRPDWSPNSAAWARQARPSVVIQPNITPLRLAILPIGLYQLSVVGPQGKARNHAGRYGHFT